MRFAARDLVAGLGPSARLVGDDVEIQRVSFDSRDVRPGDLFVPIVADRDGHDFVADAVSNGAVAYLSARGATSTVAATCIEVADTSIALIDAARWARGRFPADTVAVGITGSVGKTSTKDLVAAAVGAARRVTANVKSFNNEQGLPVTILNAPIDTEVLVLEMGMRGFGQIDALCRIARPSIGVVTRVGEAHTSLVGGLDGVARAKGELVEALPTHGVAVLNADDERVRAMRSRTSARVVTYGESPDADVRIANVVLDDIGRPRFTVHVADETVEVALSVPGRHMAGNAAAAMAVGSTLGVPLDAMATALREARLSDHRLATTRTRLGAHLLDDSYNANPTSVAAALDVMAATRAERRVAVLGVMAELDDPAASHSAIARRAADLGIEIVAVETDLYGVVSRTLEDAVAIVESLGEGTAILVKGSRVAGLERLVAAVTANRDKPIGADARGRTSD